jgi:hypothetical protein
MPTIALDVVIDGSRAAQGAQQVGQALTGIKAAADTTTASVQSVGNATRNAFQATGGTIQVAQGITQTAKAFGELNASAALFSTSRTLLEVGRTVQDFQQMRSAIGGASGAIGLFSAAWRASPIGVIATVVGLAATAMSLFTGSTKDAANAWGQLGEQMKKASTSDQVARLIGGAGNSRLDANRAALEQVVGRNETLSGGQFAETLNIKPTELAALLKNVGSRDATSLVNQGFFTPEGAPSAYKYRDARGLDVTPQQQRDVLLLIRSNLQRQAADTDVYNARNNVFQFGAQGNFLPASVGGNLPSQYGVKYPNYVEQSAEDQYRVQQENQKRIEESMERSAQYAEQIGQSFGDAIADVVLGASSLRQVLAGLLQQGVRQGLANVGGAIFSGAFRPSGQTPVQSQAAPPVAQGDPGHGGFFAQ